MLSTEVRQLLESWLACEDTRRNLTARLFANRDSTLDIQDLLDENDLRSTRLAELTRQLLSKQSTART